MATTADERGPRGESDGARDPAGDDPGAGADDEPDTDDGEPESLRARLRDVFRSRHANPASVATRFPLGPLVVYALYRRRWRLLGLAGLWTAVNPVAFPAQERTDNWLGEGVLGERLWLENGNPLFGLRYPSVLNLLDVPAFGAALFAAWTRRPRAAVAATAASTVLKLGFVNAMVRYYRASRKAVSAVP